MRKELRLSALLATALLTVSLSFTSGSALALSTPSTSVQLVDSVLVSQSQQLANKKPVPRDPAKINVLVNKKYPLIPKNYKPKTSTISGTGIELQIQTATAYRKLAKAAKKDGVNIKLTSGYRSYATQSYLMDKYTRQYGSAYAQRIAAKPGTSEHQTGLTVDVGNYNRKCALQACFESTQVGRWMAKNASKHGFILRYPKGQEKVTGYNYEPWHFRYVGTEQAKDMAKKKSKTLEHYYGVASSPKPAPTKTSPKNSSSSSTKVTTANLNLRKSANTSSAVLLTAKKGTKVSLTGKKSGTWVQVKIGTRTGWMSSAYLR
ncbi:D-alanyl-D-alanine carboxypeptidase family protein [Arthrobacter sp. MYb227]|uniref:D-alanyl-D-alanine carboxypeptidase family protein n=1 Tax=Arthrobacter sp. MYb227 TaxID=1848601 RepID=UPI0015E38AD7|nr:D-alanyl-D-alanine carboxypeptidase family protein [Arthrobacter sp. MYb227]